MTNEEVLLNKILEHQAQGQLQIVSMLEQQSQLIAQIHQMLSPPEVKKDEVSLRDLILSIVETLGKNGVQLDAILEQLSGGDGRDSIARLMQ
ncbi:hypothetical protein [Gluconobacter albidus]|uniref:hypothetical protein n=1 Tax=Gluconobacter albidus TaxID=318683 RepID=UPI0030AEA8FD